MMRMMMMMMMMVVAQPMAGTGCHVPTQPPPSWVFGFADIGRTFLTGMGVAGEPCTVHCTMHIQDRTSSDGNVVLTRLWPTHSQLRDVYTEQSQQLSVDPSVYLCLFTRYCVQMHLEHDLDILRSHDVIAHVPFPIGSSLQSSLCLQLRWGPGAKLCRWSQVHVTYTVHKPIFQALRVQRTTNMKCFWTRAVTTTLMTAMLYVSLRQAADKTQVSVEFNNVSVTIGSKDILRSVYGAASAGQMLAVMGPSGMPSYNTAVGGLAIRLTRM